MLMRILRFAQDDSLVSGQHVLGLESLLDYFPGIPRQVEGV
jgi:hypothetical protein